MPVNDVRDGGTFFAFHEKLCVTSANMKIKTTLQKTILKPLPEFMQTVLIFLPYNVSPSILIFRFCINNTMAICFLYSTVFYESEENVNTTANR